MIKLNEQYAGGNSRLAKLWNQLKSIPVNRGLVILSDIERREKADADPKAVWKPVACWHNCGGRCMNKALVFDGVVIRQKTDDTHEDSPDYPQQRGCLRGRSQRKQVFGADRLKYPMKRKHWVPGGGDKTLRGRDEWVRISWDEALDILASETRRISEKYGHEGMWVTSDDGPSDVRRVFARFGGYSSDWGTISWGSWRDTHKVLGVADGWMAFGVNDRMDLRNSQLIVFWGLNPAWTSPGGPIYHYLQAKKAGARFICIDPSYTDSANIFDADWVPVNPGTDHALALGIMHTLLVEDDPQKNPLIDWDFLHRCTVGFDRDHMPDGASPDDNFRDYLLGLSDGIARSAEWAAPICGVSPERIRQLAREIGGTQRVALLTGWAPARINEGEGWVQAFSTLGFMTGHMGKPGRMTGVCCHFTGGNQGPSLVCPGEYGEPGFPNPVQVRINHNEIYTAILGMPYRDRLEGDKTVNIQMIMHPYNAAFQSRSNVTQSVAAHRKVEFVATIAYVLNSNAKYSDLVLPATTPWEGAGDLLDFSNRDVLIASVNITPPLFEARSDQWIGKALAQRLGLNVEELFPLSEKQKFFNRLIGSTVICENGEDYEPLLTITEKDINEWEVQGIPQKGRITLNEFLTRGSYQIPRTCNDNMGYIAYEDFIREPEQYPRETLSGKFEIHCQTLSDSADVCGWTNIPPIPKYTPKKNGYESTYSDWESKIKGDYPFQVYNPHYLRRSHSTLDNVPWLREAWNNAVYVNADDAARLDIKHGDTVLITSRSGKALRPAHVTQTIKPGIIALPHGPWPQFNEEKGIDVAGCDSTIYEPVATGLGTSGWNTVVCNIEKWYGDKPLDDKLWPQRIVFGEGK